MSEQLWIPMHSQVHTRLPLTFRCVRCPARLRTVLPSQPSSFLISKSRHQLPSTHLTVAHHTAAGPGTTVGTAGCSNWALDHTCRQQGQVYRLLQPERDGISGPGTPQQGGLGERITELLRLEEVTEGLGSGGSGCVNWRVTGRVRGLVFLSEQGSDVHV